MQCGLHHLCGIIHVLGPASLSQVALTSLSYFGQWRQGKRRGPPPASSELYTCSSPAIGLKLVQSVLLSLAYGFGIRILARKV